MSRRRWIWIGAAALAVPVVAGFLFVVLIDSVMSGFGACRVVRQRAFASPSGSQLVVVVWKECGATVPDSTQASWLVVALSRLRAHRPLSACAGTLMWSSPGAASGR